VPFSKEDDYCHTNGTAMHSNLIKRQKLILWSAAARVVACLSVPSSAFSRGALYSEGLIHPDMGKTPDSHIFISEH
jgi:hypothetical protein